MSAHDAYDVELRLYMYMHRGQWSQALYAVDEWLGREPWRTELLLRRAQILRALHRYEQGLLAVREYRTRTANGDVVYQEVEFLLALNRAEEALRLLDTLPGEQRDGARGLHSRGRVLLALRRVSEALEAFWSAFQREPGFHRALVEWTAAAVAASGKWWVRRQLDQLLADHAQNPAVLVSVGLALATIDPHRGHEVLRQTLERYPLYASAANTRAARDLGEMRYGNDQEIYRTASEHILAGRYRQAVAAYEQAVKSNPAWRSVLAPLVAEMLVDELERPEEARRLLEEALRADATDYRLHLSHTRVFLHLGFGEEALSAANCALALAPESERGSVLVQRASAHLLLHDSERALADLAGAVSRTPEVRGLMRNERFLRPLARHPRFRALIADPDPRGTVWQQIWKWLMGE